MFTHKEWLIRKAVILQDTWIQEKEPITPSNCGHGMLFNTLSGKLIMAIHSYKNTNGKYLRVPRLFGADLSGDRLIIGKAYKP